MTVSDYPQAAEAYRALLAEIFGTVRETPPLLDVPRLIPELELQSLWYSGAFGREFRAVTGEKVAITQFGHWNHGAGPDFSECAVSIDSELHAGSIELDPEPLDWERHGHSDNPAFNDVVLHVFQKIDGGREFFTRTADDRNVVQVALDPEALKPLPPTGDYSAVAHHGRCSYPLRDMSDERVDSLLNAAAQYRLDQKSRRLAITADLHGAEQALYEGVSEALGYRPNRLPMRVLSQRHSLKSVKRLDSLEREATFFGAAGFLESNPFDSADTETRAYLRGLWDNWWKIRSDFERKGDLDWNFAGIRPHNHPQRRLAALTTLLENWKDFTGTLKKPKFVPKIKTLLGHLSHDYWSRHYTLTSKPSPKPMALIGKDRILDILGNVVFPHLIQTKPETWETYRKLPASTSNHKLKRAATRLFGDDAERQQKFQKQFHQQQALLQIYQDFCLEDLSDCSDCPFPEQLSQWR